MKKSHALLLLAFISSSAFAWRPSFLVGYGITNASQTQTVHLADTPSPGLDNLYVSSSRLYGSALFGLALEKEFTLPIKNSLGTAGFELDYMRNNAVNGTVNPFVNISPNFDELKYVYDIHSFALQATGKYIKQDMFYNISGYLQAGLGAAINNLSNYHEYSPKNSSAAPMLSPFGNKNTLSPALSAGIGLSHQIGRDETTRLSFGYRCVYVGRGRLMKSGVQQTNASIVLSPISYQFLMLSLTI